MPLLDPAVVAGTPSPEVVEAAKPMTDSAGFLLPHYRTFSAVFNQFSKVYRWTSDEAIKHSSVNALAMRRDVFIMGVLRERGLAVVQTPWHIEPEDPKDEVQKDAAGRLTDVIKRTPFLQRMLLNLHEASWYGRYASQVRTGPAKILGQEATIVADHRPVNGDKIQFLWDGTPCVMVQSMATGDLAKQGATIKTGERSPMLVLDKPYWRDRFVIHTHETDDADYFESEMAGGVHGVGIRSRIYWAWWLRDELLSWMISYMEKVGAGGMRLFYYEDGNATAKANAEQAARDYSQSAALAVPLPAGADKKTAGVEIIQAPMGGIDTLCAIIADYFERHIERYIIGQSMSSKTEATGIGGDAQAGMKADSKYRIIKFDCNNLEESLTTDLVRPLQALNCPGIDCRMAWVFDLETPESKDRLEACNTVISMGIAVKVDEVRAFAGLSKPDPDDEVVGGPGALVESDGLPPAPPDGGLEPGVPPDDSKVPRGTFEPSTPANKPSGHTLKRVIGYDPSWFAEEEIAK